MGMSTGGTSGYTNEPNVIPMIDILLVLLIIFMMQVAQQRKAMDIQLPPEQQLQQEQLEQQASNQIVLLLGADGSYALNADTVAFSELDAVMTSGDAVMKGLNAEEQAAMEKFGPGIISSETNRFRLDPTMSYVPADVSAEDPEF